MGDADNTTPYQAELVGIEIAVENALAVAMLQEKLFWFFTDNQTLIKDLTKTSGAKPGMAACAQVRRLMQKLLRGRPDAEVALIWCPLKKDVPSMTQVDSAAKEAALLPQRLSLALNPTSIKKRISTQLKGAACTRPSQEVLKRLMKIFEPTDTFMALCSLPLPDATIVAQLRSGHFPLNAYLHCFKAGNSPNCDLCQQVDNRPLPYELQKVCRPAP